MIIDTRPVPTSPSAAAGPQKLDAGALLQKQAGEVRQTADPGYGNTDRARLFFRLRDQVGQRIDRKRRRYGDEHGIFDGKADRQEIAWQP
jgi:hypothetical protein